jgi:hypothetical protein
MHHRLIGIVHADTNERKGAKSSRLTIQTDDLKHYQIEYSGLGKELLNLVNSRVEVVVRPRERLDGSIQVSIQSYRIVDRKVA